MNEKKELKINAYAKINLFLEVTGRRPDGYHELDTVMQTVSLHDEMTVAFDPSLSGIALSCRKKNIPQNRDNIIWKCAERFFEESGIRGRVEVHINKRIPVAAGLGGGSSDGAAVLCALNELSGAGLSKERLCAIAAKTGSDIPFLVGGGCASAKGVGEILEEKKNNVQAYFVIASGSRGSRTPAAYKALDDMGYAGSLTSGRMIDCLQKGELKGMCGQLYNAFENAIFALDPEVGRLKNRLLSYGADGALMSGSGSSVFGVFEKREDAERACGKLCGEGCFAVCAQAIDPMRAF